MTDRRGAQIRQLVLIVPALAAVLLLSGCSRGRDGYGGTAVLALGAEPTGLNPLTDRDIAGNIIPLLFSGLTRVDEQLAVAPDLAESWEVSGDGLQWTFHLRKGVLFHDGVELTAKDVVYTIRSFSDPRVSPRLSQLFGAVQSVEAVSTYDARVSLRSPYAPILNLLTVEVLPAHLLETGGVSMEAFSKSPVGTGPFRLQEWKAGEIVLVADPKHFAGRPYLDSVVFRLYADRKKAWAELMQAKVDLVPDLEAEDYAVIRNDDRFQVASDLDFFYYTLLFNMEDPLLREPAVREAIDLAVDRGDIISGTLGGFAQETTGPFVPGTWAYDPSLAVVPYEPEKSRTLLSSAGWVDGDGDGVREKGGRPLELDLIVDKGDTLKVGVAQRIKWQLYGVGMKVNVEFLDPQELVQGRLLPGRYQSTLMQFNAAGDPDAFTYLFWHSRQIGSSNLARYRSAVVDGLIEEGRVEPDLGKRVGVYRAIHREMAQDRPAVFLFVPKKLLGMSSRLEGVGVSSISLYGEARTWKIGSKSRSRR